MSELMMKTVLVVMFISIIFLVITNIYLIDRVKKVSVQINEKILAEMLAERLSEKLEINFIRPQRKVEKRVAPELMEYTSDYDLLVKIVYLEARGEPFEGKVIVAATVLNRVLDENFPNTIREVILQEGQFQPAKYLDTVEVEEEYLEEIELAIYEAMAEEYEGLYFVNPEIADKDSYEWMKNNLEFVYEVDNHEFYK
jgi:N-acetylmuramoyl-L-alanine amidase